MRWWNNLVRFFTNVFQPEPEPEFVDPSTFLDEEEVSETLTLVPGEAKPPSPVIGPLPLLEAIESVQARGLHLQEGTGSKGRPVRPLDNVILPPDPKKPWGSFVPTAIQMQRDPLLADPLLGHRFNTDLICFGCGMTAQDFFSVEIKLRHLRVMTCRPRTA